jgi:hypothetical protein
MPELARPGRKAVVEVCNAYRQLLCSRRLTVPVVAAAVGGSDDAAVMV